VTGTYGHDLGDQFEDDSWQSGDQSWQSDEPWQGVQADPLPDSG